MFPRLYFSPRQQLTVSFKVQPPAGISYQEAAAFVSMMGRAAVFSALVAPPADPGSGSGASLAAGWAGRWLGHLTEQQCLRGCVELVMRLQYDGSALDEAAVAEALTRLHAELARRLHGWTVTVAAPTRDPSASAGEDSIGLAPAGVALSGNSEGRAHATASVSIAGDGHEAAGGQNPFVCQIAWDLHPSPSSLPASQQRGPQQPQQPGLSPSRASPAPAVASTAALLGGGGGHAGGIRLLAMLDPAVVAFGFGAPRERSRGGGGGGGEPNVVAGDGSVARKAALHGLRYKKPYLHLLLAWKDAGRAQPSADGRMAEEPPPLDVRVVVTQFGAVVAKVERLTVEPRGGASVRLDLSGLEKGSSASLLVLPSEPRRPEGTESEARAPQQMDPPRREGRETGENVPQQLAMVETVGAASIAPSPDPVSPMLYFPIAVVPRAVADELCDLMAAMEDEAFEVDPLTDPRVIRARVFTDNFSVLVSDFASLVLGWERLGEEMPAGQRIVGEVMREAELRDMGDRLVSYMTDIGLVETVWYLDLKVQNAGGPALMSAMQQEQQQQLHESREEAAEGEGEEKKGEEAEGEEMEEEEDRARDLLFKRPAPSAAQLPKRDDGRQRLYLALRALRTGFRDPASEEACVRFRCRESVSRDLATAVFNAVVLMALVFLIHGSEAEENCFDGTPASSRPLKVVLRRYVSFPSWDLIQLALSGACLVLPALLLAGFKSLNSPSYRDPALRTWQVVCLVLLYIATVKYRDRGTGPVGQQLSVRAGAVMASLVAVSQPASYSIHVKGSQLSWAADFVVLTLLFRIAAASTRDGAGAQHLASWLVPAAAALVVVLASIALMAVRDLSWRISFLKNVSSQQALEALRTGRAEEEQPAAPARKGGRGGRRKKGKSKRR